MFWEETVRQMSCCAVCRIDNCGVHVRFMAKTKDDIVLFEEYSLIFKYISLSADPVSFFVTVMTGHIWGFSRR